MDRTVGMNVNVRMRFVANRPPRTPKKIGQPKRNHQPPRHITAKPL
jgi:hypothetical protein